jgi:hypothetical protein
MAVAKKEIVGVVITASNAHDSRMSPKLLSAVAGQLQQVSGDTMYDTRKCYQAFYISGAGIPRTLDVRRPFLV